MNPLLKEIRHNPLLWLLAFVPVLFQPRSSDPKRTRCFRVVRAGHLAAGRAAESCHGIRGGQDRRCGRRPAQRHAGKPDRTGDRAYRAWAPGNNAGESVHRRRDRHQHAVRAGASFLHTTMAICSAYLVDPSSSSADHYFELRPQPGECRIRLAGPEPPHWDRYRSRSSCRPAVRRERRRRALPVAAPTADRRRGRGLRLRLRWRWQTASVSLKSLLHLRRPAKSIFSGAASEISRPPWSSNIFLTSFSMSPTE